ncbi:hypothetical protein TNCT_514311 [Trichonephila clavata]|uniref:Uncharacterized protein n=1 Tax=Trichonephila clavata TaxID=2740835 RepID=A0A8X6HWS5_TRICU|nr:hypothetical protein TNCT_514311 [Trichonephila clavata]
MPCMAKRDYRLCERNVFAAATSTAKDFMNDVALVVKNITKCSNTSVRECRIYVDDRDIATFLPKFFYSIFIHRHWDISRLGNDVKVLKKS